VVLFEPERTQFDLRWRMFGISVRVHPLFWLVACLLGASELDRGAGWLVLWVGCVFVSILVHELGHVLMGRAFGSHSHIVLYGFGGLAIGSNDQPQRWQRIAVLFAGPLAGFALFGVVCLTQFLVFPPREDGPWMSYDMSEGMWVFANALDMLWRMNLFWSIANLVPIYPLDGGQISREICTAVSPGNGLRISLGLSFLLSAFLAVHCLLAANGHVLLPILAPIGSTFNAILFGLLAVENLMMLQQVGAKQRRPWDEDWPSQPPVSGRER
jgi:stage IV sporulation protein FB